MTYDIPYSSEKHKYVSERLRLMIDRSRRKMSMFHTAWEDAEKEYQSYIATSEEDKVRKAQRDKGTLSYSTIYIPYNYAILLAAHTYWCSVFLSRTPVFQYLGRHGESEMQTQAVEALIEYQTTVGRMLPAFYIWLLDTGKYGIGILGNYWDEERVVVPQMITQSKKWMGIPIPGKTETVRTEVEMLAYQGNRVYNIRPYDFLPDPSVSLANFQRGEFCARRAWAGWHEIVANQDAYQNLDILRKSEPGAVESYQASVAEQDRMPDTSDAAEKRKNPNLVESYEIHAKIVPSEWGLADSNRLERAAFTLTAKGSVIIQARAVDDLHDSFPFFVQMNEVDGYAVSVRGILEVTKNLNEAFSWLLNSHIYNVRQALNNQLVADPSKVEIKDLVSGGPGKIVRLKPAAYGSDVRTVLQQIPFMDVTQTHLRDMQAFADLIQRVSGVTDATMGMVHPGGRKTATEIRTSSSFSVNRLRTFCEWNSALAWAPLAQVLLQNTQQRYDTAQSFRIAGDALKPGNRFIEVPPEQILGFYDWIPVDGTLPIDRYAMANLWRQTLADLVKLPQIATQFDLAGIFGWMARLAGLKNVDQFRVQTLPPGMAEQMAGQGNLIPAGQSKGMPDVSGALAPSVPIV